MTSSLFRRRGATALVVAASLALTACANSNDSTGDSNASGDNCGTVNMAINPWVGYEANAAVVGYLLNDQLGCEVVDKNLKEQVSWEGFSNGTVDVIIENWGHDDLAKKYIDEQGDAVDYGPTGNEGIIGWYVPQWMADEHPDITDWKNLNKYADLFKTSESGDQGQLLDGDPSYVTNDENLVANLDLNYKVVYAGSEAAEIKALEVASEQKTPLLFYFYTPQWALANFPVAHIDLPPYTKGCDVPAADVACDYPPYTLNKIVSTTFDESGGDAATVIKNFSWTNDDQNAVAEMITNQGMTDDEAAKEWVDANPDIWQPWFDGTSVTFN
ncbi:MAG: ABC transporter substrate-binding protein [Candidatus Nanopelagicales bacterium]